MMSENVCIPIGHLFNFLASITVLFSGVGDGPIGDVAGFGAEVYAHFHHREVEEGETLVVLLQFDLLHRFLG